MTEFGEKLGKGDAEALLKALRQRKRELLQKVDPTDPRSRWELSDMEAGQRAVEQETERLKLAKAINERNRILNRKKRLERTQWLKTNFGTRITEGMETLLVGINKLIPEARFSVMNVQRGLVGRYLNGFVADMNKAGHWELFTSGTMENEIADARFALGKKDEAALAKLPRQAVAMAKTIDKWQEALRLETNAEGAYIGKLHDFVAKTLHDGNKILRMGEAKWRALAEAHFDLPRMLGERHNEETVEELLTSLYTDLSSGNHTKFTEADDAGGRYVGPMNLARQVSHARTVHFKTGSDWIAYNREAGHGTLHEAVARGLVLGAKKLGLMKVLGTNPGSMYEDITKEMELHLKGVINKGSETERAAARKQLDKWENEKAWNKDVWLAAVDGSTEQVGNRTLANHMTNLRGFIVLGKLAGMIFSQFNDLATFAMAARYRNKNFMQGLAEGIGAIMSPAKKETLLAMGTFFDSMAGNLGRQGSLSDIGRVSGWVGTMMRWNLAGAWTERLQGGAFAMLSHEMGGFKDHAFAALDPHYQKILGQYGIDAPRWDAIRTHAAVGSPDDGKWFIEHERLANVPDAQLEAMVRERLPADQQDKAIGKTLIDRERRDLELRLRTFMADQADYAVISPDAKTRGYLYDGSKSGTKAGELLRAIMQFKGYSASYTQRVLGRELYGRGANQADTWYQALRHGNGELTGVTAAFLSATAFGYLSLQAKNLIKGKSPEDLSDPRIAYQTFLAAAFQGGGLGVFTDGLLGQSHFGGGALEQAAGPLLSSVIAPTWDLARQMYEGNAPSDLGTTLIRVAVSNTPYATYPGVRWALDYLVLNDLYEWMNPGYLSRTERRMQQRTGQHFLVEPR